MISLVIVIVHERTRLPDLLEAWQKIGIPGVTILKSTGGYHASTFLSRLGLGALDRLLDSEEGGQRTLLAAIDDEEMLTQAIAEAERTLDGFDRPGSGLLIILPVSQVRGLHKLKPKPIPETLPAAVQPDWVIQRDTPISQVMPVMNLKPTIVQSEMPLDEVAHKMEAQTEIRLACVVDQHEKLIGIIDLHTLADDLFFHILPEEFISEVTDLEHVLQFAEKSSIRNASDAMLDPVWVKQTDKIKDAFKRMHEHNLPGLPVVDDNYHVIGYINLLSLLVSCLPEPESKENEPASKETPT
jgi:CBS domain-containing protein